jgi:transcriptional regulator with XRE-family HTH domain
MRLKEWRLQRGIKVSCAAANLGVATSTWNHWESGRRFPSGLLLLQLIAYTGISLKQLICENAHICPFCSREPK